MDKEHAMQHGLGYAAGREDGSNVRTVTRPGLADHIGFTDFAEAYAEAWDRYNREIYYYVPCARDAYETWQATQGQSVYRLAETTSYSLRMLAQDGYRPAAAELVNRNAIMPEYAEILVIQ